MKDLLEEAKNLVRMNADKSTYERAKAYWIGEIDIGLGGGDYVDTYHHTFEKTLKELGIPSDLDEDTEEDDNDVEEEDTEDDSNS